MTNPLIAFRAEVMLIAAIKLAAQMNGVNHNEELRRTLSKEYAPYMRMLEARAKSPGNKRQNETRLEVAG